MWVLPTHGLLTPRTTPDKKEPGNVPGPSRSVSMLFVAHVSGDTLATELRAKPLVFLAHGDADPMVPFESLATAVAALGAAGLTVSWHAARGVGHGIDPESLSLGTDRLVQALSD